MTTTNVKIEERNSFPGDKAYRFNHDGYLIGSTWIDEFGRVVQVIGDGMAGMVEVKLDDGYSYLANPTLLTPYQS